MIIDRYLMVQLGLIADCKRNVLIWDETKVFMKQLGCQRIGTGKPNITKHER